MQLCLQRELVERYVAGSCSIGERGTIEGHLSTCEHCRVQVQSSRLGHATVSTGADRQTDIYSLGVILYHMLTGQYPYEVTGDNM
ncbi:zf-HC2 domain-containing protein [Planctomycetota bacterium]